MRSILLGLMGMLATAPCACGKAPTGSGPGQAGAGNSPAPARYVLDAGRSADVEITQVGECTSGGEAHFEIILKDVAPKTPDPEGSVRIDPAKAEVRVWFTDRDTYIKEGLGDKRPISQKVVARKRDGEKAGRYGFEVRLPVPKDLSDKIRLAFEAREGDTGSAQLFEVHR